MTFYGRIREKGPDPTGSGSATLDMSQLKEIWFGRNCAQMPRTLNSIAINRAPIISHDKQVHLV